jgi:transaldolase
MEGLKESVFRHKLAEDQMATEKLTEGIEKFAADADALEKRLQEKAEQLGTPIVVSDI